MGWLHLLNVKSWEKLNSNAWQKQEENEQRNKFVWTKEIWYTNTKMRNICTGQLAGWQGNKICKECGAEFWATSGARKFCNACVLAKTICSECHEEKSLYDIFCGNSCAGKWKQRTYPQVRTIDKNRLSSNRGKAISKAKKGKPRLDMRGENNPNWNGGTYGTERHKFMGRVEYKNWRRAVFTRDDYTCQKCDQRGGRLNADHIKPYSDYPQLALELGNGQTLCVACHKIKTKGFAKLAAAGRKRAAAQRRKGKR